VPIVTSSCIAEVHVVVAIINEKGQMYLCSYDGPPLEWRTSATVFATWAVAMGVLTSPAITLDVAFIRRAANPYKPTLEDINADDAIP
jgi:hypothetical protein